MKAHNYFRNGWLTMVVGFCFIFSGWGQNTPTKPTYNKVLSDLKKDAELKEAFEKRGIPFNRVKFSPVDPTKHPDKVFFDGKKATNHVYNDRSSILGDALKHFVIAEIPKDIYGATYRIVLEAVYHRLEKLRGDNYKFYKNWEYSYTLLNTDRVVTPLDAPKLTDDDKINFVQNYIISKEKTGERMVNPEQFGDIVKVLEIKIIPNHHPYEKAGGINKFKWNVAFLVERGEDRLQLRTEKLRKEYIIMEFLAELNDAKYTVKGLTKTTVLSSTTQEYSWEKVIDRISFDEEVLEEEKELGNWYDNGFEAIYQKYAEKKHAPCSIKYLSSSVDQFKEIIGTSKLKKEFPTAFATLFQEVSEAEELYSEMNEMIDEEITPEKIDFEMGSGKFDSSVEEAKNSSTAMLNISIKYTFKEIKEVKKRKSFIIFSYNTTEKVEKEKEEQFAVQLLWSCEKDGEFKITGFEVTNF